MAKKSNGATNGHNGHVSVAREEYDAFHSREESYTQLVSDNAKVVNRNHDLIQTCNAQAARLAECDVKVMHLERIVGMQRVFIDMLRADANKIATLEDLSEFWRQWALYTGKAVEERKLTRTDVARYEPDLFKSWRNWVHDVNKLDRMYSEAGTRTERDALMPKTQKDLQEHILRQFREDNNRLAERVSQLETELEAHKNPGQKLLPMKTNA